MTMASSRTKILSLYKQMLRESSKFSGYNYRTYTVRRVRDAFKENKEVSDSERISTLIKKAEDNLQVIKRQVVISQLYKDPPLVIESKQPKS